MTTETTYNYNNATARLTSVADVAGTTTFTYYFSGLIHTIDDPLGATGLSSYSWDSAGRLIGRIDDQALLTWARGYDPNSGLVNSQSVIKTGTSTTLASFSLGYDVAGNLTQKVSTVGSNAANGTWSYSNDAMGRMTQAVGPNATGVQTTSNYTYDGASDRTSVKDGSAASILTTYDNAGYPTSATDGTTYTSDKIGDLLKVDKTGTANDATYGFDAYARLVCAKMATTATCSGTTTPVTWALDAMDRTVSRTSSVATTNYTYRGLTHDPIKIVAGSTTTTYALGLSNSVAQKSGSTTRFFLTDLHDDVAGLVDTTASIQGTSSYTPWGGVLATSGSTASFGFQNGLTDPTTSQVDMGTRWYDSAVGRFSSRDTVFGNPQDPATMNQFAYANGAPVLYTDPTGMSPECKWVDGTQYCYTPPPSPGHAQPEMHCNLACATGGGGMSYPSSPVSTPPQVRGPGHAVSPGVSLVDVGWPNNCQRLSSPTLTDYAAGTECVPTGFDRRFGYIPFVESTNSGEPRLGKPVPPGDGCSKPVFYSGAEACYTHDYMWDLIRYGTLPKHSYHAVNVLFFADLVGDCGSGPTYGICTTWAALALEGVEAAGYKNWG